MYEIIFQVYLKQIEDKKHKKLDSSINDSKNKINYYTQFIERFEQITAEFRIVLRGLNDIQQMLLEKMLKFPQFLPNTFRQVIQTE